MPLLNTASAIRLGSTPVVAVYQGATKVWPPSAPVAARRVVQYVAPAASTSIVIPTVSTTPGKDLILLAHSGSVMTMPAGWTKTNLWLDATDFSYWRLPAASHTASLASVTMTQSAARRPSLVMIESEISGSVYLSVFNRQPISAGSIWGTDVHTFSKEVGFALYSAGWNSAGDGDAASFDQGYSEFADTGAPGTASVGDERTRIWMAKKEPAAFTNDGVTATMSPALSGNLSQATFAGMIAWDVA